MIVVLEGPDGVGKSTLADALEATHGGTVHRINNGPPPNDVPPYLHYSCMIDDVVDICKRDKTALVVIDRFHVGELIYAPMFRGTLDLSLDEARAIDHELTEAGVVMVHCYLSAEEMIRRQLARDGGKPDEKSGAAVEHARAIRQAFIWACGKPGRSGALSTSWMSANMMSYPDQLAHTIRSMTFD